MTPAAVNIETYAPGAGDLVDVASGVAVRPGRFTALATAVPEEAAAITDRLGRYAEGDVTLDGRQLSTMFLTDLRSRVLVADNAAKLFTGRLRDTLDVRGRESETAGHQGTAAGDRAGSETGETGDSETGDSETRDKRGIEEVETAIADALYAACADDIVAALPGGLDAHVAESGREFSGGQQQRLRLVRALVADPDILILVEPTSAVDAHTEARIAERLAKARAGRTTLVCTTSPLVLDHADHVLYVEDGVVRAEGTHRELLTAEPGYRSTVTRGED
ncbi:ABC transporter ATP-binding protein [Streptosporangiaceae bacterium NEAU-GS5]|nr:ABC transporter ATP-binding protein [Streptosporangiaceae bacterium NEAU-GS5]